MEQTLRQLLGDRIETKRLILKRMTPKDAHLLWKLYKEKGNQWFFPSWKKLPTRKEIMSDLNYREEPHYAIIHKKNKKFLGLVGMYGGREFISAGRVFYIFYFLHQQYEGNGYMTEAVNALCRKLRHCHTPYRITLSIDEKNRKSLRVAQKCGFDWKATDFCHHFTLVPPRYEKPLYKGIEKVDWDSLTAA